MMRATPSSCVRSTGRTSVVLSSQRVSAERAREANTHAARSVSASRASTSSAATDAVSDPVLGDLIDVRDSAPYVQLYFDTAFGESIGGAMNDAIALMFAGVKLAFALAAGDKVAQIGLEIVHRRNAAGELLGRQNRLERAEDLQRPVA